MVVFWESLTTESPRNTDLYDSTSCIRLLDSYLTYQYEYEMETSSPEGGFVTETTLVHGYRGLNPESCVMLQLYLQLTGKLPAVKGYTGIHPITIDSLRVNSKPLYNLLDSSGNLLVTYDIYEYTG